MSSGRLFRSECFSAFRMCSFSVRQSDAIHDTADTQRHSGNNLSIYLSIYIYMKSMFCMYSYGH